ncbi:glutathione-disulfide reductase [Agrilactobacillus composti DSM 18527 = JCM 14202]|uniref:Glutathione-disulfide reductase n=1 Tax=Agrilactobacillus composti DSM 18527 = JCM 14202 TaxID=1423734 RepID=A0A0R1Y0X3_9LACO|nr:glutathione-disulfide reductase [Agrilactobacillus composti DSM 18527 = JCM 14202]
MELNKHYDVIIFGAGPGGTAAAYGVAHKKSVLVIENDLFGGTCPNRGCDPKKMLYSAVQAKVRATNLQGSGLKGVPTIDWPDLMAFKRQYTRQIPKETENGLQQAGIATYHGQVHFLDEQHVQLADKTIISGDDFILATGRRPRLLDIPGQEYLKTSTDFLDLDALPKRMTFVGAGLVTMELANIANQAGVAVDILHHNDQPLKEWPTPLVTQLVESMASAGIHFHFNTNLTAITKQAGGYQLTTDQGILSSDYVVAAVGRIANTEALKLENCGVTVTKRGIAVDDHLQTSTPHIYALGDVMAKPQPKLTPVAAYEGQYLAQLLTGQNTEAIDYPVIPQILFGTAEVSQVGVTYQTAENHPKAYQISTLDLTHWYTYNRLKDPLAQAVIIRATATQQVVGFAAFTTAGEQLLNLFSLIMNLKLSNTQIQEMIFAYPTAASDLTYLM